MVDRIGKGGGPPEPPKTTEGAKPASTGRTFEVPPSAAQGASATAEVSAASPALEQLRAGHIDLEGYVQAKLEEATAHLKGLRPADLEMIRRTLREKMASDPTLVELARQATGGTPTPPPEDE